MSQSSQRIKYRRNPNPPRPETHSSVVFESETCIRSANRKIQELERLVESLKFGPHTPSLNRISDEHPLFPQFSRFPLEIRIEIWKQALPEPRMIEITTKDDYRCLVQKCPDLKFCDREIVGALLDREPLKSRSPLLLVCHESHSIVLEAFAYCLGTEPIAAPDNIKDIPAWLTHHEPACEVATKGIRFQPACDTIYLRESMRRYEETLLKSNVVSKLDTSKITSLAIDGSLLVQDDMWKCLFVGSQGRSPLFTALKKVFLLRWEGEVFDSLGWYQQSALWDVELMLEKFQRLPNAANFTVQVLKADEKLFREGFGRWNMPSELELDWGDAYRRSVELHKAMSWNIGW